jgi:hypothetical protein
MKPKQAAAPIRLATVTRPEDRVVEAVFMLM